jgi:hypothetical protein
MKIKIFLILFLFIISSFADSVTLTWIPDSVDTTNVSGYNLYCGSSSGNYTNSIDVGNTNTFVVKNIQSTTFFALKTYDALGDESDFSNEAIYIVNTNTPLPTTNPTIYLGVRLDYGTSLVNLNSIAIPLESMINPPNGQFYRASLIITNKSFLNMPPITNGNTNNYVFLGERLDYGTSLANLSSDTIGILVRTNPPIGEFYRSSLIITNNSF